MHKALVLIWSAALVFLVSLVGAASAQDAVAVITELKFNRGDIQLRATNGAAPTKPAVLQSLYTGNVVQTTKDAVAVIFYTDGSRVVTVDEKNPIFEARASSTKDSAAGARVKEVANLLVGKKKPPTYVALSVRGKAQPPTLLSPRNSAILSESPTGNGPAAGHGQDLWPAGGDLECRQHQSNQDRLPGDSAALAGRRRIRLVNR